MRFKESDKRGFVPVLCYHRVDVEVDAARARFCVTPENFRRQMEWLARKEYRTAHLGDLLDYFHGVRALPSRPVVITFDDGYYCNYRNAFPIMSEYGLTGTVFLIHDRIRKDGSKPVAGASGYLSTAEALEMQAAGWEFHSHGMSHRRMTELDRDELDYELGESRRLLSEKLGRGVRFFCYPHGRYDSEVQAAARANGYRGACGPSRDHGVDDFAIGRVEIFGDDSLFRFGFKVRRGASPYGYAVRTLQQVRRAVSTGDVERGAR